jgi:hypothetical protein
MGAGMTQADLNHHQVVSSCLQGKRPVDEQILASLAILSDRLNRVRQTHDAFSGMEFSTAVRDLQKSNHPVPV